MGIESERGRRRPVEVEQESKGWSPEKIFEDNVEKLVKKFRDKPAELKELIETKGKFLERSKDETEREHTEYELKTFEEAIKRIGAKKETAERD